MLKLWLPHEPLVLASSSAVRLRLLEAAGLEPVSVVPEIDERELESTFPGNSPAAIALILARAKAQDVSSKYPGRIVIGADQVLSLGIDVLHKAHSISTARDHLMKLRGCEHRLDAAVAVACDSKVLFEFTSPVKLTMRTFSNRFLDSYLEACGSSILGSVGCYHIEGMGIHLFDAIDGDIHTIMGLPMLPLLEFFRTQGLMSS